MSESGLDDLPLTVTSKGGEDEPGEEEGDDGDDDNDDDGDDDDGGDGDDDGHTSKGGEDEPGEEEDEEEVEPEVPVEVRPDPLPLEPEEARDHRVLQQMPEQGKVELHL